MAEYLNIRRALEKRLAQTPSLPADGGVPRISWENTPFKVQQKKSWLRASLFPVSRQTNGIGIGSPVLTRGLFLIDIFTPDSKGTKEAEDLANLVLNRFSLGLSLTEAGNQVIILTARKRPALNDAPWYLVPIEVEWYLNESI